VAEHEGGLVKPSSLSALAAAEAIAKENKVSLLLAGSGPALHKAAEHGASSHPLVNEVLLLPATFRPPCSFFPFSSEDEKIT
jgi:electron transfer flavoprotein alpha subunit